MHVESKCERAYSRHLYIVPHTGTHTIPTSMRPSHTYTCNVPTHVAGMYIFLVSTHLYCACSFLRLCWVVALIHLVFSPQPGCSYSVVVKSDEENGIDHSLPGSRLVQVGSVVVLAVNVCVQEMGNAVA